MCKAEPSSLWQLLSKNGNKLIYEVDDDFFSIDPSSPIAHGFFSQPDVQDRIRKNAEAASMVTVTTEPLAKVMREFNDNVMVIPNYIDEAVLEISEPKNDALTIGWAGSATHQMDFYQAGSMLKKVAKRHPETRWHFSGADYGRRLFPADRYTFTDFKTDIFDHYRNVATLDIGLAPLKSHRFNDSKSAIKLLEYFGLGIPVVASPATPYRDYFTHGECGFFAEREYDWVHRLSDLINDKELREAMSLNAKAFAREHTIQANAHKWESAIRSLLD